jgi:hypothetical protein
MFPLLLETVTKILDPSTIRWIGFSHFEADACGALNNWLEAAPSAEAVCTFVGALVSVNDFATRSDLFHQVGDVEPSTESDLLTREQGNRTARQRGSTRERTGTRAVVTDQ